MQWRFETKARRAARSGRGAGFTLLEVLLTLAVIGLVVGILVVGAIQLTEPRASTPEEIFWKAVNDSRRQAMLTNASVQLRSVAKNKSCVLVATGPSGEKQYPFPNENNLTVDFLSTQKAASAILIGGQLVETQTMPSVTFYGDGTCTPFRAQFRVGVSVHSVGIDPWTCAPVLSANANPHT